MSDLLNNEKQMEEKQDIQIKEDILQIEDDTNTISPLKAKFTKKKFIVSGVIFVAIIIAIIFVFTYESEFKKIKGEVVEIAGVLSAVGDDYFTVDTYPESHFENFDSWMVEVLSPDIQENALEAIKFANEKLGFNSYLYSKMLDTTALMGRQSEENDKYKVSWTYHPDAGLEVTYEIK